MRDRKESRTIIDAGFPPASTVALLSSESGDSVVEMRVHFIPELVERLVDFALIPGRRNVLCGLERVDDSLADLN